MARNLETASCVNRPSDIPLGDLLSDMGSWLDNQRIETVGFDLMCGQCEVRFTKFEYAHRFQKRFA